MRKLLIQILVELQGIRKDNAQIYGMLCYLWDEARASNGLCRADIYPFDDYDD